MAYAVDSRNGSHEHTIEHDSTKIASSVPLEAAPVAALRPIPPSGSALAIGAFATTLTTLSLSLMGWRGVAVTNVYIGNFFFVAGIGMLITAQWELVGGNGFAYSVFSAFGLFYAGYGAILTPAFGVEAAYGSDTQEYNNALGLFVIMWTVFVLAFLVASLPTNVVYILIFLFVELCFLFIAASYFALADGHDNAGDGLKKAGGVFGFLAGLVGWYLTFALLIKESIVELPLGDTSRFFAKSRRSI